MFRLETIANVLTVAVALAAILLSVWEGIENRRHNRLSVLPHLEPFEASIGSASPIENEYFFLVGRRDSLFAIGYGLENTGLGPAVLTNIMEYRGDEKIFDAAEANQPYRPTRIKQDLRRLPFVTGAVNEGYAVGEMLQADAIHHLITVMIPFSSRLQAYNDSLGRSPGVVVMEEVLEQRSIVFCYCSVYEEDCGRAYLGAEPPASATCNF